MHDIVTSRVYPFIGFIVRYLRFCFDITEATSGSAAKSVCVCAPCHGDIPFHFLTISLAIPVAGAVRKNTLQRPSSADRTLYNHLRLPCV